MPKVTAWTQPVATLHKFSWAGQWVCKHARLGMPVRGTSVAPLSEASLVAVSTWVTSLPPVSWVAPSCAPLSWMAVSLGVVSLLPPSFPPLVASSTTGMPHCVATGPPSTWVAMQTYGSVQTATARHCPADVHVIRRTPSKSHCSVSTEGSQMYSSSSAAVALHADGPPKMLKMQSNSRPDRLISSAPLANVVYDLARCGHDGQHGPPIALLPCLTPKKGLMSSPESLRSHLRLLEDESIFIMREVAAEFERPCLLFSGGKDSIVMLRLAEKAFRPGRFPFPLMHIDTGHNFPEVIAFRDKRAAELGERLIVRSVEDSIRMGRIVEQPGQDNSRNRMQTTTLLDGIAEFRFDAVFGGARRDEEKARAKERIFSFRDVHGQWDPKNQRPELWNLYNGRIHNGEHIRVFPISNWTELDIWQYIAEEQLEIPSIYYAHQRPTVIRNGLVLPIGDLLPAHADEVVESRTVRFRTVGDATCTACIESPASDPWEVIEETAVTRITERGATRVDDRVSEASMEDRKRAGYF